jgi:hypothetical protein
MTGLQRPLIKRLIAQLGVTGAKQVATGLVQAAEAAEATRLADEDARLMTWKSYVDLHFAKGASMQDGGVLLEMLSYFEKLTKGQYNKEVQAKLREIGIKAKGKRR